MAPKRHDPRDNTRKAMIALLTGQLADAIDLRLALKQAHRNIEGANFVEGNRL